MLNPEINPTPDEATDIQRALSLFDDQVSFEDLTSVSRSTLGDDCPEINTSLSFLDQEQLQMMQQTICLLKLVAGEEASDRTSSMLEGEFNLPARYRAECRLGEGGFGIVLRALDLHLNRWVAVKIPKLEVTLAPGLVARFLREAENVAQLDHPNIVPVLATDETLALPLIIYHFCDGPTLAQWLIGRTEPVEPLLAVRIVALLADAVHHAHQHGILHRDLKPTNVLLERSPGISSPHSFADGPGYWTPRITDFGVAKVLTGTQESLTATGLMMGTVHYMAPEQLASKRADIGWHSDVYSLGVMLFEILTTKRPYEGDNAATLLLQMRARDPNLRRMRPDASRDLEAVVHKALSLEQNARYATAQDFASDLRNILDRRPVEARPVSLVARLHRWTKRQPAIAALSMASIVLLLIACIMIAIYVREITQTVSLLEYNNSELTKSRDESAGLARQLRNQLYVSDMQKAWDSLIKHDPARYEQIIQKYDGTYRQPDREKVLVSDALPRPSDVTDLAYDYLRLHHRDGKTILNLNSPVYALALDDYNSVLAACGRDGTVRLISCSTDELIKELPTAQGGLCSVDFSPDRSKLATLGENSSVCVWDVRSGTLVNRFQSTADRSHKLLWLDSDRVIVCGNEPIIRIWKWRDGSEAGQLKAHTKGVEAIALSGHRDQFFSGGDDGLIFYWSLKTGQATQLRSTNSRVLDLEFMDHQGAILYGDNVGHVTAFVAIANGGMIATGHARDSTRTVSALLPSGRAWAAGSNEGVIHLHEQHAQLNRPSGDAFSASWQAHTDRVYDLLFMPNEQWLYSAGKDGQVKKWPLASGTRAGCRVRLLGCVVKRCPAFEFFHAVGYP